MEWLNRKIYSLVTVTRLNALRIKKFDVMLLLHICEVSIWIQKVEKFDLWWGQVFETYLLGCPGQPKEFFFQRMQLLVVLKTRIKILGHFHQNGSLVEGKRVTLGHTEATIVRLQHGWLFNGWGHEQVCSLHSSE